LCKDYRNRKRIKYGCNMNLSIGLKLIEINLPLIVYNSQIE